MCVVVYVTETTQNYFTISERFIDTKSEEQLKFNFVNSI